MKETIPDFYEEQEVRASCLRTDKHLLDRKELFTIFSKCMTPFIKDKGTRTILSNVMAVEMQVLNFSGKVEVDVLLDEVFLDMRETLTISKQAEKAIRAVFLSIHLCSKLK